MATGGCSIPFLPVAALLREAARCDTASPSPYHGLMPPRRPVYLDHHATTPVDPRVLDAMLPYLREDFGNASSTSHQYGWRAEAAVEDARERIAAGIGAETEEIIFTSGATESNNLALQGTLGRAAPGKDHVVIGVTEHPSVSEVAARFEREGRRVTRLPVDGCGMIDPDAVEAALDEHTALVSIAAANGEIGALAPIGEIGRRCRARDVVFHSDASQALGKIPLDTGTLDADLLSFSGHKIYGPKGIGALYVRRRRPRLRLRPLFEGGGQERGLRPGTLPVPQIVGLARALELCLEEREAEAKRLGDLSDSLLERIRTELDGVRLNGPREQRLPANLNLSFERVDGERLLLALSDLAISSGSACSSASNAPSHVLEALGHSDALAKASLRFGLGRGTTVEDIEYAAARVVAEVRSQRG